MRTEFANIAVHRALPPDRILTTLPRAVWFSAVGESLTVSEIEEANNLARGLELSNICIEPVTHWHDAKRITDSDNWMRDWWQAEQREERRLSAAAAEIYSADAVMKRMTEIMEGSSELFLGPAAVASTRAGVSDPALERCAAGAAAQALHQFALAALAGESSEHCFAIKFRLFLAGRWPLSFNDNKFYIF